MRILFLTNYYPPHEIGGYEQLCRDVAVRLTERGYFIGVLTSDRGATQAKEAVRQDIYRLLHIQPQFGVRLSPVGQFWLTRRASEARNLAICRRVMWQFRPDVILIWNLEGLPHELALEAEATAAVAYWVAGNSPAGPDAWWLYWTHSPAQRAYLHKIKEVLSRAALVQLRREGKPVRPRLRHVAVVSEYILRKGLAENVLPANAEIIYNGVEVGAFYRPVPCVDAQPPIKILLAGRIGPDKGVHVAIDAIGRLAQIRPQRDFHFIVVGSGPQDYCEQLHRLARQWHIEDLISFLGWQPRELMPSIMHQCHILLLPAIYPEAFARVVIEGMASGLAVIATLAGGTGELLRDEANGLVCAIDDSHDLTKQIARLLDDPQLRFRLATRGQGVVLENYSLDRMVDRLEGLLERAFTDRAVRRVSTG